MRDTPAHAAAPPSPPPARARRRTAGRRRSAGLLAATGMLAGFERDPLDARYELRGTHAAPDVVVVGIDEDTLAGSVPLPRVPARARDPARCSPPARARSPTTSSSPTARATVPDDEALLRAADDPRVVLGTAEVFDAPGMPAVIGVAPACSASGGRIGSALLPVDDDGVWRRMEARVAGPAALSVLAAGGDARRRRAPDRLRRPGRARPRAPVPRRPRRPLRPARRCAGASSSSAPPHRRCTTPRRRRPAAT